MALSPYRGRFAPSPTGLLHLGSARTALVAWLRARASRGAFVLRVEDLDPPRVIAGAAAWMLEDLRWLGLDWDEGPDVGGPFASYTQSERLASYDAALARLVAENKVFPCTCTRRELATARAADIASAPHGPDDFGPRYPGTCRSGPTHPERPASLRFRSAGARVSFVDGVHGACAFEAPDDFVVRRADGLFAYQLAVVVDDAAMQITEVVRGDDLLSSTPRQLVLYEALGLAAPAFAHVPIVLGPDGERLAKRHGAISIRALRERGERPEQVVGKLAHSLGLVAEGEAVAARELVADFALDRVPHTKVVLDAL